MSFQSLKVDELKKVAASFAVEPKVADKEHGPTKKELLAALAENGVSWQDYQALREEVEPEEEEVAVEEEVVVDPDTALAEDVVDADDVVEEEAEEAEEAAEDTDEILVKYVRKNPTWEQAGYRFTQEHPFKSLSTELAERLIKSGTVVQALPSEVKDYYN